jgi:hypothetical protein
MLILSFSKAKTSEKCHDLEVQLSLEVNRNCLPSSLSPFKAHVSVREEKTQGEFVIFSGKIRFFASLPPS